MARRPEGYGRPKILFAISSNELRRCLSLTLNRAAFGDDPVLITRRGLNLAAIISIEDLNLLERMKTRREIARSRGLPDDLSKVGAAIAQRLNDEMFFEYPCLDFEEHPPAES